MLDRIDHLIVPVPDLATAAAAYERLGLTLTPLTEHQGMGTANRAAFIGTGAANFAYIELLGISDRALVAGGSRAQYVEAADRGGALSSIAFGTNDTSGLVDRFTAAGISSDVREIHASDGRKIANAAVVDTTGALPFAVTLLQYPESWEARYERSVAAGRFEHTFPLKRLDHLAAVAPDIEAATDFWTGTLGVSVAGEIRAPGMIIRQLQVGDAIVELLGPDGPGSRMAGRPAALASMAAWEVSGSLDDAVALARGRGFTVSEPEPGVIPGTRRASIPAGELAGLGMQLLEYV
jgi:catechol 2,3-dioxygenase-like lactoylglutathione lyase family enzyme